jgi:hypothetical protein
MGVFVMRVFFLPMLMVVMHMGVRLMGVLAMGMRSLRMCAVCVFVVSVFVCRIVRREHVHLGGCNSAAADLAHFEPRAYVQRSRRLFKAVEGNTRIHKSAQQHVAADAGKTFQIANSHRDVILNCPG